MWDSDNRRLRNCRVSHEHILQLDRTDPLAARFNHIFAAILDLHVSMLVDGDDIAGLEPAIVGEAIGTLGVVIVRAGHPGTAHFQFAHADAIPGHQALLATYA